MDCYVADGYWDIGYTESDICVIVPAGSPGGGGGGAGTTGGTGGLGGPAFAMITVLY